MGAPAVLFTNVSPYRVQELVDACAHMPYRVWAERDPKEPESFRIVCDKSQGREASGDAGGASPNRAQARAATRGPGPNPGRSTVVSLTKLFGRRPT